MSSEERRRKICYVATSLPIENDFRFAHKQCPGLVKRGFAVTYFGQGAGNHNSNGVEIHAIKREKNKLMQALLPWRLLGRLAREGCDAYHLSTAEWLPASLVLKLISRRRVVFDFREDYVEFVRIKPYVKGPLKYLLVGFTRLLVWLVCKSMDGIIFGDEGVQQSYPYAPSDRRIFIHHFPPKSLFGPNPVPFSERPYDVVYLGSMSETGGIFVMLEALYLLKQMHKNLKVLLIGRPAVYAEERFNKFVKENALEDSIQITGKVPYTQVPALLDQAKVGLIGLKDLPKFHRQSASKLFEYMAKGIPCVSVDLPPERRFMIDGEDGYFVPAENPQAMTQAVHKILSDPKLGQQMAETCRKHFIDKGYYAETELDKLAEFYERILT